MKDGRGKGEKDGDEMEKGVEEGTEGKWSVKEESNKRQRRDRGGVEEGEGKMKDGDEETEGMAEEWRVGGGVRKDGSTKEREEGEEMMEEEGMKGLQGE